MPADKIKNTLYAANMPSGESQADKAAEVFMEWAKLLAPAAQ